MKARVGPRLALYPMPTVLVGALVGGKPNYVTVAHVGIADLTSVSLSLAKVHHTNKGIRETGTFSINIPGVDLVKETDYCGLVSGADEDKSRLFDTFFGKLKTAPMIRECPVSMECRLIHTVDFPGHDLFIGEVVETHCDYGVLTEGVVDLAKVKPILFSMGDRGYWQVGDRFASAWKVGKEIEQKSR